MKRLLVLALVFLAACNDDSSDQNTGAPAALVGRTWKLTALTTGASTTAIPAGVEVSLNFGADRNAGGNNGCNGYGGEYSATSDGKLAFGALMQTEMACDEPRMSIESAYMRLLQQTATWSLAGGTLTLTSADGTRSGKFR